MSVTPRFNFEYAVVDATKSEVPQFWSLEGFALGNANEVGWNPNLIPTCKQGSAALLAKLKEHKNYVTLAIQVNNHTVGEYKFTNGLFFDQLMVMILDPEYGYAQYKLALFNIKIEKVTITPPTGVFRGQTRNILCKVVRGGYVGRP